MEGTLRGTFNDRGFTFVEPDPSADITEDIFLHIRAIADGADSSLFVRGARVEFDAVTVKRGTEEKPQARNARVIPGAASAATAPIITHEGRRGTPKFWWPGGYGFIKDEESGDDYFAGAGSVPHGYLRLGDVVEFDVAAQEDGRFEAVNVRLVDWAKTGDSFEDQIDMGARAGRRSWRSSPRRSIGTIKRNHRKIPSRFCAATPSTPSYASTSFLTTCAFQRTRRTSRSIPDS
jgi:cold shock CspA family protein